ncbi:MAG: hypothetical protein ACOX51_07170 [Myxococcota bacterium]|jgi:hypothetical protein|nr:hypothetical protein [Myxococcota bacterium]HON25842.1 hypothetical protein [Myxococcota bacterium]HOS62314.1 hypothetical protein [Myxococcota bacterium]HPC91932.1 hypothetical protein [Myxococcota bacterium]HPL25187.1 hypothetical protein [Myxococcota bacterium]
MSAQVIGSVKSGSGKTYQVKWDSLSREVYVTYAGSTYCGKASSAGEAMRMAEAYVYNK